MTPADDDLDALVAGALRDEVADLRAGPALLDRIEAARARPAARGARRGRVPWVAAAAVLVVLGALGVLAVVGGSEPTSVTAGAPDAGAELFLPGSVPAGYELVEAERAVPGQHVAHPLTFSRAHLVGPDGVVVFADWVEAPSALRSARERGFEVSPLESGAMVAVSDTAQGAAHSEVRWTGAARSGWLISSSSTAQALEVLARRFVAGEAIPPPGYEVVPVYDERGATRALYTNEDPTAGSIELLTYHSTFDLAAQQRVAGEPAEEVAIGGSVGLASGSQVVWAPTDGVAARLRATDLDAEALLAVASSVGLVSEEAWRAASQEVGADPRPFAWRTIARGITADGGGWAIARRDPIDGPGCFNLFVLEVGGGGPAQCGGGVTAVHTVVAARVPAAAVEAELVAGERVVDAEVHPIDDRWSVAVGHVEDPVNDASAFEVRAVDGAGEPVG